MTEKEVEITVEETKSETISICDGCGEESSNMKCPPCPTEDNVIWGGDKPEPLHFCSEECIDSVRATTRVAEGSSPGVVEWVGGLVRRVVAPYGNVEASYTNPWIDYVISASIPAVAPAMYLGASQDHKCDHFHRVSLFGFLVHLSMFLLVAVIL